MTLYGLALGVLFLFALYLTGSLYVMKKDAQRMTREIRSREAAAAQYEVESAYLYAKALEVYQDANNRWMAVVRLEGRVH